MNIHFPFIVTEIQLRQNEDHPLLDMYFVGETNMLHYQSRRFQTRALAFLSDGYSPFPLLQTPFSITDIRENTELDAIFFHLDNGGLLRASFQDPSRELAHETIEYFPMDSHPDSYFQTLMEWFSEANPVPDEIES
ncbi:MAG: hypothetical protein AAF587_36490 [Bacteroidota bacterium]